jgi:hypothetical protein
MRRHTSIDNLTAADVYFGAVDTAPPLGPRGNEKRRRSG